MTTLVRSVRAMDQNANGYAVSIDCTGGNLLIAKVMYSGSSGVTVTGAPTVGGSPMASVYFVDAWQNHVHIYYMADPPAGVQSISVQGNGGGLSEQFVAELYSDAGVPENVVDKTNLTATDSVIVATGGSSGLISSTLYVGGNVSPATPVSPLADHQVGASGAGSFNTGTRPGTGADDSVEYSGINEAAGRRLVAFNIPDMSGPQVAITGDL